MRTSVRGMTAEVIESRMESKSVEALSRLDLEVFKGNNSLEVQVFNAHVVSSKKLRTGLLNMIAAIFAGNNESANGTPALQGNLNKLLRSGKVTFKQLQAIEDVCRQFFFLGWQARDGVKRTNRAAENTLHK